MEFLGRLIWRAVSRGVADATLMSKGQMRPLSREEVLFVFQIHYFARARGPPGWRHILRRNSSD